jgi:Fur family ferric uptake transcriptional regulator/Fur family peroxide stress response transcriptional regulator
MNKRNTLQKKVVYDIFSEMCNHPSASMVYEAVHEKYPNISRATVFRLLAEAAEEGDILRLKLVDSSDRYDITTKHHHHIVCRHCGAVADVDLDFQEDSLLSRAKGHEDFLIEESHLEFLGVCKDCRATK